MTELSVSDEVVLSPVRPDDRAALVDHLQAHEIWRNTLYIPHPYTEEEADTWIEERISHRREQPAEVTFAIRNQDGTLIGVVGADDLDVSTTHRANLGYWLAKPYWGRGIMTRAARRYVRYALTRLDVARLTAEVFVWNEASQRVLEKVGFRREGRLRKHREKEGALVDVFYYGLLREDVEDDLLRDATGD